MLYLVKNHIHLELDLEDSNLEISHRFKTLHLYCPSFARQGTTSNNKFLFALVILGHAFVVAKAYPFTSRGELKGIRNSNRYM